MARCCICCRSALLAGILLSVLACGTPAGQRVVMPGEATDVAAVMDPAGTPVNPRCALGVEPRELRRDGNAVLLVWELAWQDVFAEPVLPPSEALAAYRQGIVEAGAALREPVADPPVMDTDELREIWRREFHNRDMAYSGDFGTLRPMQCLEALFFAYQTNRFPELTQPTEFIVAILRREVNGQTRLRAYFAASDTLFPPKAFYPFDEAARDAAEGWEFWLVLHNHTVQRHDGKPALGVPAPSTNDVALFRSLAAGSGLQIIQVTNGFFTVEIPAGHLDAYEGPVPPIPNSRRPSRP